MINNTMAVDPFAATKRTRSSSEEENSDKEKPQTKKKENTLKDVKVLVSDGDDDTGAEEDDYMITVDTWKDLPKSLRGMVKNLIKMETTHRYWPLEEGA
jgi:hypothetical protein